MARQGRGGGQRPIKGFRPGKEPPELRKRRAKEQYGDVSATQERLIEVLAERTPGEARRLIRRWRIGLLAGAIVLAVVAAALLAWSWIAAAIAGVLAVVLLGLWWRMNRQREALEAMADAVGGPGKGRRKRR
jgi:Flp pilus assembly protein TadB